MNNNIQSLDKHTPHPSMHILTAVLWTWVFTFFGVWMVLSPSRDKLAGWDPTRLEGYLLKLIWSRPAGIIALLIALIICWIATNPEKENSFRNLIHLAVSSAFGASIACIPARGEGFAIPVLQEAGVVALITFFAVILSRFVIFPIFTAIVQWQGQREK